jgi:hypothetical protein
MSISESFLEIREIFNNSRKEQRIAFLEVLSDLTRGAGIFTSPPKKTIESEHFKPVIESFSEDIVTAMRITPKETLLEISKMIPKPPEWKVVSSVWVRKDRTRISWELRDYYKTITEKEEDDIASNKRMFLTLLERYSFIEKQDFEETEFGQLYLECINELAYEDSNGKVHFRWIDNLKDERLKRVYKVIAEITWEEDLLKAMNDGTIVEVNNYYIDRATITELYSFLTDWEWSTDYQSSFDIKNGEVKYKRYTIPYNFWENPYLVLKFLYSVERDIWIDLEDTYSLMSRLNRWNKRCTYDQGWEKQIKDVIKNINRRFKEEVWKEKLIKILGNRAILEV